jgi:hypothetical protein
MSSRLRTINRVLGVSAAVLAGLLIAQITHNAQHQHGLTGLHASWRFAPQNLGELDQLASEVVIAKVMNIRRGNDLVMKIDGEPGNVDRIPTEIVTLQVEESLKGSPGQQVEVYRTGLSVDTALLNMPVPKKPVPSGQKAPDLRMMRKPTPQEANRYMVNDDPGYEPGQRVLLYLTEGPEFAKGTRRIVAPEGRFMIGGDNKLMALVDRGAAMQLKGKAVGDAINEIRRLPKMPVVPQLPKAMPGMPGMPERPNFPGIVPRGLDQGDAGPEAQGDGPQAESLPPKGQ